MTRFPPGRPTVSLLTACSVALMLAGHVARATDTSVDFAKNSVLTDKGILLPNGPLAPSNGFGTTFNIASDASGNNKADIKGGGAKDTLDIPVSISSATDVYTLIDGFNPYNGDPMTQVDFFGTGGAYQTFTLVNGIDVRDFNSYIFAKNINGTTTRNAYAGSGPDGPKVIDEQHFALSPDFAGQTLTDIRVSNEASITGRHPDSFPFLMGVTVRSQAAVPEPESPALLGLGLPGLLIFTARKRRAR